MSLLARFVLQHHCIGLFDCLRELIWREPADVRIRANVIVVASVYAAQFAPQWAKALRSVDGSAPWPIAPPSQMENINRQTLVATG
jgi:hypothetical protein